MLARKISASSAASAGRNGRNASAGCARPLMAGPPTSEPLRARRVRGSLQQTQAKKPPHPARCARHPLPQGERVLARYARQRVSERVARSLRQLPSRAVLRILEHNTQGGEFVTDAIAFLEILCSSRLQSL